jgi:hypothetical protein
MLRFVAFASIVFISAVTHAQVPHVFVAGERASAQQVNENFADVDSRISSLEQTACTNYSRAHSINYSARPSNIGDEIVFLGNTFRMIKVPFVEFSTGDRYTIMYPEKAEPSGDVFFSFVNTWHEGLAEKCVTTSVAGHPSRIFLNEMRQTRVSNNGSTLSASTYQVTAILHIVVNETLIQLNIEVSSPEQEQLVAIGDYDFSDDLDTALMQHRVDLVFAVDDLVDYIVIQAEP